MTGHVCTYTPADAGVDVCTGCGASQPNRSTGVQATVTVEVDDGDVATCALEVLPDGGREWRCRTGDCAERGVEQFLEDAYQAWRRHLVVVHPTAEGVAA